MDVWRTSQEGAGTLAFFCLTRLMLATDGIFYYCIVTFGSQMWPNFHRIVQVVRVIHASTTSSWRSSNLRIAEYNLSGQMVPIFWLGSSRCEPAIACCTRQGVVWTIPWMQVYSSCRAASCWSSAMRVFNAAISASVSADFLVLRLAWSRRR